MIYGTCCNLGENLSAFQYNCCMCEQMTKPPLSVRKIGTVLLMTPFLAIGALIGGTVATIELVFEHVCIATETSYNFVSGPRRRVAKYRGDPR